jgi:hypothetical protein
MQTHLLLRALGRRKELEAERRSATAALRTRVKELTEEIERLRESVDTKTIEKELEVEDVFDFTDAVVITEVVDTRKVVDQRPMTPSERQQTLPGTEYSALAEPDPVEDEFDRDMPKAPKGPQRARRPKRGGDPHKEAGDPAAFEVAP